MRKLTIALVLASLTAVILTARSAQSTAFFPVDDIKPGMVGIGRTVFSGNTLEEFRATVIGVLRNATGPRRDLILARLEGGPLATTGVIQGMSGSPVYIDGRLVGAVSYALGSFPKEPIAGITPIAEMTSAIDSGAPRSTDRALSLTWPAQATEVFAALGRLAIRAQSPLGTMPGELRIVGPQSLAELAPSLRPIGAAMVLSGFTPEVDRDLRQALAAGAATERQGPRTTSTTETGSLAAGDAVGMSLIHGDLEMGATGTVTYVNNNRVYAFGHPFLNLGPTAFPMTKARVFTVLPSLESSMKIAALGPVIGTINQDRATAVGGTIGAGPREVEVNVSLSSDRAPARKFSFSVLRDQTLTPLFSYVAVLSALSAYERETGVMTVAARGTVSFGQDGQVTIDDLFSGDSAGTGAAMSVAAPVGAAMANEFRNVTPERIDVEFRAAERREGSTIDRVWLDTIRPRFGARHQLQVQLQDYRGAKRVISIPITMPSYADGPLTLVVNDAPSLKALEEKDLRPGKPTSWTELLADLNATKRNNRLYVRLVASSQGTVIGGDTLPALPPSIRSVLDTDASTARAPVTKTVVGSWEQRLDVPVRGSRELTLTLTAAE